MVFTVLLSHAVSTNTEFALKYNAFTDHDGFLTCPVDVFDPKLFGIGGREAERKDPSKRFLVKCS
jgi:acyl transferase domain-containing protein